MEVWVLFLCVVEEGEVLVFRGEVAGLHVPVDVSRALEDLFLDEDVGLMRGEVLVGVVIAVKVQLFD